MPDDILSRTLDVIAKAQHIPRDEVTIDKTFADLKIDSLDGMSLLFAVESEFDISIPDDASIHSVREMVDGITKLVAAKQAS